MRITHATFFNNNYVSGDRDGDDYLLKMVEDRVLNIKEKHPPAHRRDLIHEVRAWQGLTGEPRLTFQFQLLTRSRLPTTLSITFTDGLVWYSLYDTKGSINRCSAVSLHSFCVDSMLRSISRTLTVQDNLFVGLIRRWFYRGVVQ